MLSRLCMRGMRWKWNLNICFGAAIFVTYTLGDADLDTRRYPNQLRAVEIMLQLQELGHTVYTKTPSPGSMALANLDKIQVYVPIVTSKFGRSMGAQVQWEMAMKKKDLDIICIQDGCDYNYGLEARKFISGTDTTPKQIAKEVDEAIQAKKE